LLHGVGLARERNILSGGPGLPVVLRLGEVISRKRNIRNPQTPLDSAALAAVMRRRGRKMRNIRKPPFRITCSAIARSGPESPTSLRNI
jgi:hypothetical protein